MINSIGPSIWVMAVLFLFWVEARLIAGHVTLSPIRFLAAFSYGAVGAAVVGLLVERLAMVLLSPTAVSYTVGPAVEELAKAVPVLIIGTLAINRRRLAVADLALLGFAAGLGFQFVEANLNAAAQGRPPLGLIEVSVLLPGVQIAGSDGLVWGAGHALWTGLVGLAVGISLRSTNYLRVLLPTLALLIAMFDHGMFNWERYQDTVGYTSAAFTNQLLPALHYVTLKGRFEVIVLPIGLLIAAWLESRRYAPVFVRHKTLMLAGEQRHPSVLVEWWLVIRYTLSRPTRLLDLLAYLRHRRAYAIAAASIDGANLDPDPILTNLEVRLESERMSLEEPSPATSASAATRGSFTSLARRIPVVQVCLLLALCLLFAISLPAMPEAMSHLLFSAPVALVLASVGATYPAYVLYRRRRLPPPDPLTSDGDTIAGFTLGRLVLAGSLLGGLVALVGWLLPRQVFSFGAGILFLSGPLSNWVLMGGHPSALIGAGAGTAAAAADTATKPPDPCEDWRRWIRKGDVRLRAKKEEIRRLKQLQAKLLARKALPTVGARVGDASTAAPGGGGLIPSEETDLSQIPARLKELEYELKLIETGQRKRQEKLAACLKRTSEDLAARPEPAATPEPPPTPTPTRAGQPFRPAPSPQPQPSPAAHAAGPPSSPPAPGRPTGAPKPPPAAAPIVPPPTEPVPTTRDTGKKKPDPCVPLQLSVNAGKHVLQAKAAQVRELQARLNRLRTEVVSGDVAITAQLRTSVDGLVVQIEAAQLELRTLAEDVKVRQRALANCWQRPDLAELTDTNLMLTDDLFARPQGLLTE